MHQISFCRMKLERHLVTGMYVRKTAICSGAGKLLPIPHSEHAQCAWLC